MTILVSANTTLLSCGTEDGAVATMNPATMETLQLFRGDTIIVRYVLILALLDRFLTVYVAARSGMTPF